MEVLNWLLESPKFPFSNFKLFVVVCIDSRYSRFDNGTRMTRMRRIYADTGDL